MNTLIVPIGWDTKLLGECFKLSSGKPKPNNIVQSMNDKYIYPVFGGNGIIGYSDVFNLTGKRIVIGRVGEYCGTVRLIDGNYWITDNALYTSDLIEDLFINYLCYNLEFVNLTTLRNKGGQPLISQKPIYAKLITIPPHSEQIIISNLLTLWDKAIVLTHTLIDQKVQQKKALMQKLLSGQLRLDRFQNKWKNKPLSELIIPISRPVEKPNAPYLALGIRSHGKGTFLKPDSDPKDIEMDTLFIVKENDLVVNITFAWEGAIAIAGKQDEGGLVSHRFPTFLINKDNAVVNFMRYVIVQPRFKYLLGLISPGGAGRNRVLSKTDLLNLEIKVPGIEEQQAIANILQTTDNELRLIKNKLELLKEQKKGLMQNLLTGQIRVK